MMKGNYLLLAAVALVTIIGIGFLFTLRDSSSSPQDLGDDTLLTPVGEVNRVESSNTSGVNESGGQYLPFTATVLSSTANTRRVLFFYANWCPTCRPADQSFSEKKAQLPVDVSVIRVNYNDTETDQTEKDLAAQYGVTYQHTFVQIDAAGNEVTKWNGGQIDELLTNLR